VFDSIKLAKPLPKMESASQGPGRYHPIFSRALEGSVVCIDGFKPVVRDNMSTLTRLMNAKHAPVLNSEVTHLIAETVRCDSYQASIYIARGLIADNMVIRQPQHWASRSCVLNG
jgi:hypothetical protein